MGSLLYRKDIDGLRAIAVLSVMICHANPHWLSGGFVGVDSFFVISGFLITSIIYQEIDQKAFTFSGFYLRRIKRILPVFFLVLFSGMLFGCFLLLPDDLKFLMQTAKYAILFASNVYFSGSVDYFAPSAIETPFIHMWSLAVEEQYYFVWPVILMLIVRFARKHLMAISMGLCVVSFVLASVLAHDKTWAMWSFYQLPARMGELLVGSMLAFYKPAIRPNSLLLMAASVSGIALLFLSMVLLDKDSIFPGYNALWPCLGTALLIFAGGFSSGSSPVTSVIQRVLSSRTFVFIGKLSYSLYLWHWPFLAFSRYYTMNAELPLLWLLVCGFLTFTFAYFSWKYLEQPVRNKKLTFAQAVKWCFVLPAVVCLVIIVTVMKHDGIIFSKDDDNFYNSASYDRGCNNTIHDDCHIGGDSKNSVITTVMFGDSHARHYSYVIDELAKNADINIDLYVVNSCGFMLEIRQDAKNACSIFTNYLNGRLDKYDNIILVLRWRRHFQLIEHSNNDIGKVFHDSLESFVKYWTLRGKKVYLVAQAPEYEHDVLRANALNQIPDDNHVLSEYKEANILLNDITSRFPGAFYLSFDPILSGWKNGMIRHEPGYGDAHHLNKFGQRQLLTGILADDKYLWFMDSLKSESLDENVDASHLLKEAGFINSLL